MTLTTYIDAIYILPAIFFFLSGLPCFLSSVALVADGTGGSDSCWAGNQRTEPFRRPVRVSIVIRKGNPFTGRGDWIDIRYLE